MQYDGWEPIGGRIGRGGQGTVYRARSPQPAQQLKPLAAAVERVINQSIAPDKSIVEFARNIVEIGAPDPPEYIGALKQFEISADDKAEAALAIGRLKSEVHALQHISHPSVLKLLHQNVDARFIITEFHQNGTLDRNLYRYKGKTLDALTAFRKLVDGVCQIHKQGAVHRDIKPENIFVSSSGDLVLGDFGIVFFVEQGRLTTTLERVGTTYWMAPWAYKNERLDVAAINPSLDVYPLGKVLWSMISGRNGFPYLGI